MESSLTDKLIHASRKEVERHEAHVYPSGFPAIPPIPVGRYIDPEFFGLEQKYIWSKNWLYAGYASEIPHRGSYKLWEQIGLPVVIVRGKDDQIRAFYNTCRHRGGALVREEFGNNTMLVCKFHAWTYDLNGKLAFVPGEHDFAGLDKSELGLVPLRCELWGNLIFVNQDMNAPPLKQWLGPLAEDFDDLGMETRRAFQVVKTDMPCNWKIVIDAFVESYHLPQVHPNSVSNYVDHRGSHIDLYDGGHSAMYTLQKKGDSAAEHSPINAGGEGSPEHRISREVIRQYTVFPNIQCSTAEHEFAFLMFWPTSIRTTRVEAVFTAPAGRDDPDSIGCKALVTNYGAALAEDLANLSWLQKSIESGANQALQISYIERRIYHLAEAIDRCIGVDNIPKHLRIPHLLEPYHLRRSSEATQEEKAQVQ